MKTLAFWIAVITICLIPAWTYAVTCNDAGTGQTTNIALCKTPASDFAAGFVADYHGNLDAIDTESTGVRSVATGGTGTSTAFTLGSVVVAGASGVYAQDNSGLFFNVTTDRLGINTATPGAQLDIIAEDASTIGARITGFSGQTADLLQVRNSAGATRFVVDSTGTINGFSNASFGGTPTGELFVESNGITIFEILSPAANDGRIYFGDDADNNVGSIVYDHFANDMVFTVNTNAVATWTGTTTLFSNGASTASSTHDFQIDSSGNTVLDIMSPAASSGRIYFTDPAADGSGRIVYDHSGDTMAFNVNGAERLRINAIGSLGIGTGATVDEALDVVGKIQLSDLTAPGADGMCWDGTAESTIGDCTSLRKYKTDIQDMPADLGLHTVLKMRPRVYTWTEDKGGEDDIGFVAEEVEEVSPLLADYAGKKLSGVKYRHYTASLTKAIQQMHGIIEKQNMQIQKMARQIARLEGRAGDPRRLAPQEERNSLMVP